MPIYEYRCSSCSRIFPRLQSMGAAREKISCPNCGSVDTKRILSSFAATSTSSNSTRRPSPAPCGGGGG